MAHVVRRFVMYACVQCGPAAFMPCSDRIGYMHPGDEQNAHVDFDSKEARAMMTAPFIWQ
ncbi:hypothetical protein DY468_11285 [Rhodopseudomonas sp. BR0M22]|nr:hypothetical protein [Rhodopseudomonas sp. BR0M22]